MRRHLWLLLILTLLCTCCTAKPGAPQASGAPASPSAPPPATATRASQEGTPPTPEQTPSPSPTAETSPTQAAATPEPAVPTLDALDWQNWPVLPTIGAAPALIYAQGLTLGNNPSAFSKIGDCGSTPAWFLGDFDRGPRFYQLGEYQELSAVITEFQGSYGRTSLAAKSGFNASSVFASLWSDRAQCQPDEFPLACEYRIQRPSFAFVMLGSNDVYHLDAFETQMRKIIEFSIEQGVVPILATKADNAEGDGAINTTLARLSLEYDIPLLNYWKAVQPLPDHGLQADGVHLTWGANQFDDEYAMQSAWAVRNLLSLQILDLVWKNVTSSP